MRRTLNSFQFLKYTKILLLFCIFTSLCFPFKYEKEKNKFPICRIHIHKYIFRMPMIDKSTHWRINVQCSLCFLVSVTHGSHSFECQTYLRDPFGKKKIKNDLWRKILNGHIDNSSSLRWTSTSVRLNPTNSADS